MVPCVSIRWKKKYRKFDTWTYYVEFRVLLFDTHIDEKSLKSTHDADRQLRIERGYATICGTRNLVKGFQCSIQQRLIFICTMYNRPVKICMGIYISETE